MLVRTLLIAGFGLTTLTVSAGDWPQWRGPGRDAKVTDFKAPATWPKELAKKWTVKVGDGVATPSLVSGKLYVFSREGGSEVLRCLDAATGKEVWADKYDVAFRGGPDGGFPGPRCSPAVADGKIVTLGVNGTLSCVDTSGKKLWRVETKGFPRFHTSSSPVIADKTVIAQFGGEQSGGVTAYDLADGKEKWKWTDEGSAYASPVLMTVDGTAMVVVETDKSVVGLGLQDGKLKWKTPFVVQGRGYNASTPIVDGSTVIFSGTTRGTRAMKVEKTGDTFTAKEVWNNKDNSVIYNSPVLHGKSVFGLTSTNKLFCITDTGKTAWSADTKGKGGYGSIVDAGSVLMSLTPAAQLVVYEPSDKEFKELASYKVSSTETYAYPVLDGSRVFVKDKDSVTLWSIE